MKSNKLLKLFISLFFILSCISCNRLSKDLHDGTFVGTGRGHNGIIEVEILVENGKITEAKIINDHETSEISSKAKDHILAAFLKDQSTSMLDVVSGASITSNGILDALDMALAKAQGYETTTVTYHDTSCDIVIIGAGNAGLTAATEAARNGANVIVLEKMDTVGGNSRFSTGGLNAAYTKEQERLGIKDSKTSFFNDTMKGGKYMNDPALVHKLVDESAGIVEWLQQPFIGADLSDVGIFGGSSHKRAHRPKGGGAIGAHLVPLLSKAAVESGAEIRLNNKVIDIIEENGAAVGVTVSYSGGKYNIRSRAVIIASGGFAANPDMVVMYQAALAGFGTTNHKGATGDAFAMVKKFDAELTQMEYIQIHPTVSTSTGIMVTEAVIGNGAILVNKSGKRFVNENETRDIVSAAILKGPGKIAFIVFDQKVRESLKAIEGYAEAGMLIQGATLTELAGKLGINETVLEESLNKYNKFQAEGKDEDFGRNPNSMNHQLSRAPFYAIEVAPAIHHTMGGLKINPNAQVMRKNGNPIPGLYAAGEVTGGIHGAERLGGNAVADVCIFGKIAADSALKSLKK